MKSILVFDNYPVSRMGVSMFIKDAVAGGQIYSEDVEEQALKAIQQLNISFAMVNSEGSENFFEMLESHHISLPCVVYYSDFKSGLEMKKKFSNVSGLISLKSDINEFTDCVAAVQRGGSFYCSVTLEALLSYMNLDEFAFGFNSPRQYRAENKTVLSYRENQIKDLLTEGRSTKEIGEILKLKVSTVSTNKAKIFKKLGVANLVQLIKVCEENE